MEPPTASAIPKHPEPARCRRQPDGEWPHQTPRSPSGLCGAALLPRIQARHGPNRQGHCCRCRRTQQESQPRLADSGKDAISTQLVILTPGRRRPLLIRSATWERSSVSAQRIEIEPVVADQAGDKGTRRSSDDHVHVVAIPPVASSRAMRVASVMPPPKTRPTTLIGLAGNRWMVKFRRGAL